MADHEFKYKAPVPSPTQTHPHSPVQDVSCPHRSCLGLPRAALDTAPLEPASWLTRWPANRRSTLANIFYTVIRRSETSPPQIVEQVAGDIHKNLMGATDPDKRQWWCAVLASLSEDPQAAEDYAAAVLEKERLPAVERARLKREKAKSYVLESMRGKNATPKQHALLRSKGYARPLPTDRADASELIDRILHEGETHAC